MKAKIKRSPRRRYTLWLILGVMLGLAAALTLILSLFDIRRDMVFAAKNTIFRDDYIANIEWSPDESRIFIQTSGANFSTWDAQGNLLQEIFLPNTRGVAFGWDTLGKYFTLINPNGILVFDTDGNVSAEMPHLNINRAAWNPTGNRLYSISPEYLAIWRPDAYEIARINSSSTGYIYDIKWSPDAQYFFTQADSSAAIWNADAQLIRELPPLAETSSIAQAVWANDSSSILVDRVILEENNPKFTMQLWDTQGNLLWEHQHDNLPPSNIEWSPDSNHIAFTSYDGNHAGLQLFNRDGELIQSLENHNYLVWQAQGQYFLTQAYPNCPANCDENWLLYDANGNFLQSIASGAYLNPDVWSPDGEYFLTWTTTPEDGYFSLYVWDKEGNQVHQMLQSTSIQKALWSPDGQSIVAYGGFVARIYSMDAELIATLRHAQPIQRVQWNDDSTRLLTTGEYAASSSVETAIWQADGTHLATVYTGLGFHSQISAVNSDFSQMLVNVGNHVEIQELQPGPIWFDFRWD